MSDDVESGGDMIRSWLDDRFPDADVRKLEPDPNGQYHRWLVDVGDGDLGVGATRRVLQHRDALKDRIQEAERGTWLEDLAGQHKRFVLGTDSIFPRDRESW